ncbi:MAG: rhodanese-like domain-containing protein [Chitinophagales bacterium]
MIGNWIKKLLGMPDSNELKSFLERKAIIIDVRTPAEFKEGNVKGSLNIPLDKIGAQVSKIKTMQKPIIVCCRSGARSGQAASMLKSSGIEVVNGGPWQNVAAAIKA